MTDEARVNLLNQLGIFMDIDAFADAIIIPVEVEHTRLPEGDAKTLLFAGQDVEPYWSLNASGNGHLGIEGKAVAIII